MVLRSSYHRDTHTELADCSVGRGRFVAWSREKCLIIQHIGYETVRSDSIGVTYVGDGRTAIVDLRAVNIVFGHPTVVPQLAAVVHRLRSEPHWICLIRLRLIP